jgi:hypothetical protein
VSLSSHLKGGVRPRFCNEPTLPSGLPRAFNALPSDTSRPAPGIIHLVVMFCVRCPVSRRRAEGLLHQRGIDICCETVRFWWNRFRQIFAPAIRTEVPLDL